MNQMTLGPVRGVAEAVEDLHVKATVGKNGFWIKPVYGPAFDLLSNNRKWICSCVTDVVRQRAMINLAAQLAPGRSRRKDLEGMPALLDVDSTMRFARLRRVVVEGISLALQKQLHLTLVSGSVVAGDRMMAMARTQSDTCAIDNVRHDTEHLFWDCSGMKLRRRPFLAHLAKLCALAAAKGPNVSTYLYELLQQNCFRRAGVVPDDDMAVDFAEKRSGTKICAGHPGLQYHAGQKNKGVDYRYERRHGIRVSQTPAQ